MRRSFWTVLAAWTPPVVTVGFVMAGLFKSDTVLQLIPVDLTLFLAAGAALAMGIRMVRSPVPRQLHGVLGAFLLLLPSAFFVNASAYGTDKLMRLFTFTLLAIAAPVVLIRTEADVERFLWSWAVICGVVTSGAIFDPTPSGTYAGAPISSANVDTIALGSAAGLVLVVSALALMWRRLPWIIGIPIGGVAVTVLLQSGSRGPLVSSAIAIGVAVLVAPRRPRMLRILVVVVAAAAGIYVAFAAAPFYAQQRIAAFLHGETTGSVGIRVELYRSSIESIMQHPFGTGLGQFERIAPLGIHYPHNLVLEVLVESGVFLGGLFVLWLVVNYVRTRSIAKGFVGMCAFTLVTYMIASAMTTGDLNNNREMFLGLGIAMAAYRVSRSGAAPGPEVAPGGSHQRTESFL